jgi:hypothetical protein
MHLFYADLDPAISTKFKPGFRGSKCLRFAKGIFDFGVFYLLNSAKFAFPKNYIKINLKKMFKLTLFHNLIPILTPGSGSAPMSDADPQPSFTNCPF